MCAENLQPHEIAPHSVEAEEAVLGGLLIDPDALVDLAGALSPDDFFIVRNGWVYEAMLRLQGRGDEVDYVTVVDELKRWGKLEEAGGAAYVTYLINHTPSTLYTSTYGALVRRTAYRRQALDAASDMARAAYDENADVYDVQERIEAALDGVRDRLPVRDDYLRGRDALAYYAEVMRNRTEEQAFDVLSLPWEGLTRVIPGVKSGKVILVSGFSGEGKTLLLEGLADWWAMLGHRVLYITTELTREDLLDRLVCRYTGVPYHEVVSKTADVQALLEEVGRQVAWWLPNVDYWETNGASARAIFAQIRRAQQKGRRIIFVDYLSEAVGFDTTQRKLKDAIDGFFRTLHTFAKETGVNFIIASQQTDTDHGPRVFGSNVPHQKSAVHLRLETEKAKQARIYTLDDRLIRVSEGEASPLMKLVVEKNNFGPAKLNVPLFKDGARFRFVDEADTSWTEAYGEREEAAKPKGSPRLSQQTWLEREEDDEE